MIKLFYKKIMKVLILIATFSAIYYTSNGQSWMSEVSQSGFILKKVVSDTIVPTGQPFSYTIYYTIPAGASNVTINDLIPPSLTYLGHSVNASCGTPTVVAPTVNSMGGNFSLNWASVPTGCVGSFTITVAFPNGITCPNTMVRNNACINARLEGKNHEFCTEMVITRATATNPWQINKYPIGLAYAGGNCTWATGNDTVNYQVCVYKNVGTVGQLNLVNAVVTDTLPTGAVLINSNCGATQTGNVITWNLGNLSALSSYNTVCCTFQVYYPPALFPNGSILNNTVHLNGSLGSQQQPCSTFQKSASSCVLKNSYQSGTISKWVYTNRQPGCAGRYTIYICNNGTTPLTVNAIDTLPSSLTSYSIGSVYPNTLATNITGNILTITGTLAQGQCGSININFTIPANATVGQNITNCVHLTSLSPTLTSCASFTVDAPSPKACVWKEICQKQSSYTPGSTFRYRLRVQNIGGQALTGTTITDILNPNLEYVGNPSFYTSNTWNIPSCKPNPTPSELWNGVNINYNAGTNTVTASIPTINAVCQNIFYNACGMYGTNGVPFYYIEFDVKVRDTSALGNIPNNFTISGGSLNSTVVTSNTDYVLVVGVVGYNLEKTVKNPNDANYSNGVSVNPGSQVQYKLKLNSSGTAALGHITFVDLLPKNNGTTDQLILTPCTIKNSQFGVSFMSQTGTPNPNPVTLYNNPATTIANVNNLIPTGAPGNSFTTGCGTNGTWASGLAIGNKNMGIYFGATPVGLLGAQYEFLAKVDTNAKIGDNSCNTFAASGWTRHLIQSSILSYQNAGQVESKPVCLLIDTTKPPESCIYDTKNEIKCLGQDPQTGYNIYSINLSASSCTPAILMISSPNGTFSTSTFNLTSSPWLINSTFTNTSGATSIKIYYSLQCGEKVCRDSVMLDLPPCDTHSDCCQDFHKDFKDTKLTWNSSTGFVGLSSNMFVGPSPIKKFTATIVSAQLRNNCGVMVSPWKRIYGDITGGSLLQAPGAGPQLLSIYSRQAVWGEGECKDWNKGTNYNLKMIFPPFNGGFKCSDELVFSIKYSFMDCKCFTCDTIITYRIVRKLQFLPWDPVINRSGAFINVGPTIKEGNNEIQQELPNTTSLVMENYNNGKLYIISPDIPENNVSIYGIEITSDSVPLTKLSNNGINGLIEGNTAYIPLDVKAGNNAIIDLLFNNIVQKASFTIKARFLYSIDNQDPEFSTSTNFVALVPNLAKDEVGVNTNSSLANVKSYSIYIHNLNGYKENISSISLKTTKNHSIIAVGPPQNNENGVLIYPLKQQDGSYIIALEGSGEEMQNTEKATPIYLTISSNDDSNIELDFKTNDFYENTLSEGKLILTDPIGSIYNNSDNDIDNIKINVYPNPANQNQINIAINNQNESIQSYITIKDLTGRVVRTITNGEYIQYGTHLFNSNINNLSNGTYFVEFNNGKKIQMVKFVINK